MLHKVNEQESVLDSIPRLLNSESEFDVNFVRLQEISNGMTLIFLEDYDKKNLTKIILEYNLDPDKVGIIIDEVKLINSPYLYKKAKSLVNPSKIYIRPINTKHTAKIVEDTIDYFIKNNNWKPFDEFIDSSFRISFNENQNTIGQRFSKPFLRKVNNQIAYEKYKLKQDVKKWAKRGAIVGGTILTLNALGNRVTKKWAEEDYYKPQAERSQLIARLRVLKGKLPYYENEYEKAQRLKLENRSTLRKIIDKIKSTIHKILCKLRLPR